MIASLLSRIGIEVWKDIPNYEGLYQVSNLGNVRSLNYKKTGNIKKLSCSIDANGRPLVGLWNINRKTYSVHVLVAVAFLKHKPCGMKIVVDHINNDRLNNKLYNLQLITQRENSSKDKKKGTSKYTGVFLAKGKNKWRAAITINGKQKHLGCFVNEKDAAQAYKNELKKL